MRSGVQTNSRAARIVEAVRSGKATTSRELAAMFGMTVKDASEELNRLAAMGEIVRVRTAPLKRGPCLQWRSPT